MKMFKTVLLATLITFTAVPACAGPVERVKQIAREKKVLLLGVGTAIAAYATIIAIVAAGIVGEKLSKDLAYDPSKAGSRFKDRCVDLETYKENHGSEDLFADHENADNPLEKDFLNLQKKMRNKVYLASALAAVAGGAALALGLKTKKAHDDEKRAKEEERKQQADCWH